MIRETHCATLIFGLFHVSSHVKTDFIAAIKPHIVRFENLARCDK